MNAPQTISAGAELVARALGRLSELLPDHAWDPPRLPFESESFEALADHLGLTEGERLAAALLFAVEADAGAARVVAQIQSPVAAARCMAGLVASLFAQEGLTVTALWSGSAAGAGLMVWGNEDAPLPERTLHMPPWLVAALGGSLALPPGLAEPASPEVKIPDKASREIAELAGNLFARPSGNREPLLIVRGQCPAEVERLSWIAAGAIHRKLILVESLDAPGVAAWLKLTGRVPLVVREAGPGESIDLGAAERIDAPLILATAADGQIVSARPMREWRTTIPSTAERRELWQAWGLHEELAGQVAARYRQSAGRIAEVGRVLDPSGTAIAMEDVTAVMARGGGRIDALARLSNASVGQSDIVLPGDLAQALERLRDRIFMRNNLASGLGPTLAARYRPGVRALFSGESGTGKTLAAHWLAGEAGLPLYRVDLSAMTSKWIGETEKNISVLLDTAEQGDVLLFFDEADSLFGSRTEVSDAHDRYANSQTNFLLQRIEDYTGVAILATNSRDRFDAAFARRLDMVLEFPLPDAAARRELWDRHLGFDHGAGKAWLDGIAGTVDLAGGHIRNAVLAAAARARAQKRPIQEIDIAAAIGDEYAKLGRTAPPLPPC